MSLHAPPLRRTSPDFTSFIASSTESQTFLFFGTGASDATAAYARKLRLRCGVGTADRGLAQSVRGRRTRRVVVRSIVVVEVESKGVARPSAVAVRT